MTRVCDGCGADLGFRCPRCYWPAVVSKAFPGTARCTNALCDQHHFDITLSATDEKFFHEFCAPCRKRLAVAVVIEGAK